MKKTRLGNNKISFKFGLGRKNEMIKRLLFVVLTVLFLASCTSYTKSIDKNLANEAYKPLALILADLKKKDFSDYKQFVSPDGVTIIRYSKYNTNIKTVRDYYKLEGVPDNMKYMIDQTDAIDLQKMLDFLTRYNKVQDIKFNGVDNVSYHFTTETPLKTPAKEEIIATCEDILTKGQNKKAATERLIMLGTNEFVLSNAVLRNETAIGDFIVFQKDKDNKFKLRAIIKLL